MIKAIRVEKWVQVSEIANRLTLWGFRGQENASWELDTTLHRTARRFNSPSNWLWHREYWMLRQFQRRASYYINDLPDFDHKIDWLALLQHYGAPTRLLDFSHSFYIAAFFALERAIDDSAIWAINLDPLRRKIANFCNVDISHENIDHTNLRHIQFVNKHISVDGVQGRVESPLIVSVEPERLHERLLIQQGFFLFPCTISMSFQEVLASTLNIKSSEITTMPAIQWSDVVESQTSFLNDILIKIILPKSIRYDAIKDLYKMNVTAATLFPGLDGFARSMHYHLSTMPQKNIPIVSQH